MPAGYEIKNIDDLKISYKFGRLKIYIYIIDGKLVMVTYKEYYTEIIYLKERLEEY